MNAISSYIRQSLEELRHVRWPTRQQAVRLSIIVILFMMVTGALFGFLDFVLGNIISVLLP